MNLLNYMQRHRLSDAALADRIGGCSASAVKKYKYGERQPDAARIARIEQVTQGQVALQDWVQSSMPRPARRTSAHRRRPTERAAP